MRNWAVELESPVLLERARAAGVKAPFVVADVFHLPDLGGLCEFCFDRGCYHAVRRAELYKETPAPLRKPMSDV